MQSTRRKDTAPEIALRSILHRRGLRFRVEFKLPGLRRRADIAFPRQRLAVFVDGCFWHGCPDHGTWPKANADWWASKIRANQARDADTNERLVAQGWRVLRVWEHEVPSDAADRVIAALASR
jgi:DNA mismatch endonuclease, patch repair protein